MCRMRFYRTKLHVLCAWAALSVLVTYAAAQGRCLPLTVVCLLAPWLRPSAIVSVPGVHSTCWLPPACCVTVTQLSLTPRQTTALVSGVDTSANKTQPNQHGKQHP
jgi:hypothetical protein